MRFFIDVKAKVEAYYNYFAFGMLMPGRVLNPGDSRYGFNGKEKDDEIKGSGNSYDYGFRIYDPRVARFLSTDPLTRTFAMLTPYQFASNTPIQADDIDGLEARKRVIPNEDGSTVIKITVDFKLINSSSSKVDYKRLKEEVAKQIAKDYKVSNKDANVSYEVEAVNITVVGESNVDRSKDFFIELKDKGTLTIRGKAYKGLFGFTDKMGDTESNRFQIAVTSLRDMAHTIVHELGHGSGMKHVGSEEEQRMDKLGNDGQYDPDYNTKTSPHNIMKEGKTLKSNDETVEPLQMKTATDNMHESDPKSTETIK